MYYFNSQMKLICLLRKNYGDHNFIHVTQQTKLRIAPVALVVTSFSRLSWRTSRACCTSPMTQHLRLFPVPKCKG